MLGVAGASFAVALPLASYWYPPQHQGTALGIAGAGNSGTVLAALFAPSLAVAFGWQNVLGLAIIPLAIVLALFVTLAKDSPRSPPKKSLKVYAEILGVSDAWWLMAFYSVTFGGFVGLSSFLPIYFNDQYGLTPVMAGYCTAACVFAGSFVRPFGGAVADRLGGVRTLSFVYGLVAILLLVISRGVPDLRIALPLIVVTMGALGAGNGAVFQIVPQRFARNVGVVTGLVGATGGVGGFYLAASLGYARQLTGGYGRRPRDLRRSRPCRADGADRGQHPLAPHVARSLGPRRRQRLIPPAAGFCRRRLRAIDPRPVRRADTGIWSMQHVQKEAFEAAATPKPRERLVIIGNGMSPGRALEKLFEAAPEAYEVTIFNAEPRVNYDRIMLSPVLSGEKTFEQIVIHGDGWYVNHGVTLYKGHRIVSIDREHGPSRRTAGVIESYDKLIIATGSLPIVIPVPGPSSPACSPIATSTTSTPCCLRRNREARRS